MRTANAQHLTSKFTASYVSQSRVTPTAGHVHTGLARRLRVRIVLHSDDNECTHMRVQRELSSTPAHIHIQVEFWTQKRSRGGWRGDIDAGLTPLFFGKVPGAPRVEYASSWRICSCPTRVAVSRCVRRGRWRVDARVGGVGWLVSLQSGKTLAAGEGCRRVEWTVFYEFFIGVSPLVSSFSSLGVKTRWVS
jgi:hypothetical protein